MRNGVPIGYLASFCDNQYIGRSVNGRHIRELRYESINDFIPIICAWQRHVNTEITFQLAPHMTEELQLIAPCGEQISITSPSRFKILNYEKLADALIKLNFSKKPLPAGELILGIEDYGNLKLFVTPETAGCVMTNEKPEIMLEKQAATRLLFGHLPVSHTIHTRNYLWDAFLPLPFSWNTLDYV